MTEMTPFRFAFILCFGILLTGCVDRLVVGDDPEPIERPDVTHHTPLNGAVNVPADVEPMIWFNMLMDESTIGERMDITLALELSAVTALVRTGDGLLVGTDRGDLFRSEDDGESWRWVSEGMLITAHSFSRSGDVVYVAAEEGLFRSGDGGESWSAIAGAPDVTAVVTDPSDSDRLFVATEAVGVLFSSDRGATWTERSNGLRSGSPLPFLAMHPQDPNTLFTAVQNDFVYRTTDAGASWTRLREGLTTRDLYAASFTPGDTPELLLATAEGVFLSTDMGNTFELLPPPVEGVAVRSVVARDRQFIIAGTDEGVFLTRNRGQTWSAATGPSGLALDPNPVAALVLSASNRLIAGTEAALYRSVDDPGRLERVENVPLENLRVTGSLTFGTWRGETLVESYEDFADPSSLEATTITPFVNDRALATWIANGRQGTPPVDPDPEATWVRFTPDVPLTPGRPYLIRIYGTFIDAGTGTTLSGELGPEDVFGNSMEYPETFSFTVADD